MASSGVFARRFVLTLLLLVLAGALVRPAEAVQLLTNGGFEQGLSGWTGVKASAGGCTARSGGGAVALTLTSDGQNAQLQQGIEPVGSGAFNLSGFVRATSGAPSLTATLIWLDAASGVLREDKQNLTAGSAWGSFGVSAPVAPNGARRLVVQIVASGAPGGAACLDDLSLEGPAYVPPPSTATATFVPTQPATDLASPTPPPFSTATPTPTSVPFPTSTSLPGFVATATPTVATNATATPTVLATSTPTPTAAQAAAAGGFSFVNGGFEEGLRGWQKYGGELRAIGNPHRNGNGAAALTSATTSTKWAFQVVAIDPAGAYEFSGYLLPGANVSAAYLRISWYDAPDGSGRALATDDSAIR